MSRTVRRVEGYVIFQGQLAVHTLDDGNPCMATHIDVVGRDGAPQEACNVIHMAVQRSSITYWDIDAYVKIGGVAGHAR